MAITAFITVPILFVLSFIFLGPGESWQSIVSYLLPSYLWNSLRVGVLSLTVTITTGVTTAWLISTYHFPFRKLFSWLLIMPLAIPVYIMAYAYAGLFDYSGALTKIIGYKLDIMNWWGLSLTLAFGLYPYVYLSSKALFSLQNSEILEASSLLSEKSFKVFRKVAFPMAIPAIAGGGSLVLMEVLNDYGAAKYYNIKTFGTGIFHSWFSLEEPQTAIFIAAILSILIFVLIRLEKYIRSRKRYSSPSSSTSRALQTKSTPKQLLFAFFCSVVVLFTLILPVWQLIEWALMTYEKVIDAEFFSIALQSISIAALASALCVLVSLALINFTRWNKNEWINKLSKLSVLGYAVPGAVIAIGVFSPSLAVDKWLASLWSLASGAKPALVINGTIILLIYGYVIRFMAVSFSPIDAGFSKVHNSLGESAELLGSSKFFTLRTIEFPVVKFSLISAFILVFVDIMKELPLTLILKPYSVNTLAVRAYEYASDERIAECASPSLLIILIGCIPILFLNRLIK